MLFINHCDFLYKITIGLISSLVTDKISTYWTILSGKSLLLKWIRSNLLLHFIFFTFFFLFLFCNWVEDIQWNLSKPILLEISFFCIQKTHVFGLYSLNRCRISILGLYLKFCVYGIPVYSRCQECQKEESNK
jgi:hypothetical protein